MANDKEQWWTDNHSGDGDLSEAFADAAAEKVKQEAELEQAKHALEMAKIEAEKAKISGTSQTPAIPSASSQTSTNVTMNSDSNSRWKGFWWLSSGELAAVIISTIVVVSIVGLLAMQASSEEDWPIVQGTIVGSTDTSMIPIDATISGNGVDNGTGWFEDWEEIETRNEDCYTDDYGDEYCDVWYTYHDEYTCYADVYLTWEVNGTNYSGWAESPSYTSQNLCFEEIKAHYPINGSILIEVDESTPSDFQVFTIEHGSTTKWIEQLTLEMDSVGFYDIYTCYYLPSFTYDDVGQNGAEYSGSFTRMQIGTLGESVCLDSVKDSNGPGSKITVYVNPDDPTDVRSTQIEKGATAALMVCAPCGLLLLVGLFVFVRFNNVEPGAYVTRSGAIHHHRGYYPDNDVVVINNNYGRRHGFMGPIFHRHRSHRSHRTRSSSTSRVTRSSSNRSGGGGRSRGGGRSGGGGRSSGGGGRSGGGRSRGGGGRR